MTEQGAALAERVSRRIERAIVRLPERQGRGVLVPGGFIMTAAHCLGWTTDGSMTLSDERESNERILTADGREIEVTPHAVEPVADIAVLGAVDDKAAETFEDFCASAPPVPLALGECDLARLFTAYVFTHDQGVIPVDIKRFGVDGRSLWFRSGTPIRGGTSGSPVVMPTGRLLAIVSNSAGSVMETENEGVLFRPHLTLPLWVVRQMLPGATRTTLDRAFLPERRRAPRKRTPRGGPSGRS